MSCYIKIGDLTTTKVCMDAPLITAIIPTYKRPKLLKRALRSVLAQSYPHFEILVADDASGEETDKVMQEFIKQDERVKLLKHPSNIGAIANFQKALMHATTPYVCFLADDDFFAPYFFEEAIAIFNHYPDIAFCGGGGFLIDQHYVIKGITSKGQTIPPSGYYPPPSALFAYLRSSFGIAFSALLFKRAILKEFGGFDMRIRNGADEHIISQCSGRYPVYLLTDRPFYFAFQHAGSLSTLIDYPLFEKEAACLYENLSALPFAPQEKGEIESFFKKRMLKILSNAYHHFCNLKEFAEARIYAEKMCALTHSREWKRKKIQVKVYEYFPPLATCYAYLKVFEKRCRSFFSESSPSLQADPPQEESDVALWKEYALSLEKD
jgi:glycosyltransferase involved in cell wall biosynthesis